VNAAVTIREHVLEALAAAGLHGLTMAALMTGIDGPWPESTMRAVIRKLWQAGELSRREDGTFVASGRRAHDSRYRIEREAEAEQRLAAVVRRVADAAGERRAAPLRTFKVDPALLKAFCPKCRQTVYPRLDGRCTTCGTQAGANLEQRQPARKRRGQHPLTKGQPAAGDQKLAA
jgi:hypothetical protein